MTPKLFQWQIMAAARSQPQNIVLPEGSDPRVLTAAGELLRRGLCKARLHRPLTLSTNKHGPEAPLAVGVLADR